jgi:hypothetical protein
MVTKKFHLSRLCLVTGFIWLSFEDGMLAESSNGRCFMNDETTPKSYTGVPVLPKYKDVMNLLKIVVGSNSTSSSLLVTEYSEYMLRSTRSIFFDRFYWSICFPLKSC